MSYKELLFDFLKDKMNKEYCAPILESLLQSNFRKGKYVIKNYGEKLEISREEISEKTEKICEFIVKKTLRDGYSALVVPFIISKEQASNFYVVKEEPKEEELWWWLYHLLTGVHYGNYVLNLANVSDEIRLEFRNYLRNSNFLIFEAWSGLNISELLSRLEAPKGIPINKEFILGFIFVSYFAKFWKDWKEKEKVAKIVEKTITEITDESSLLIFVLSRQKKKVYVLPKLRRILSYWYSDFSETGVPCISKFVFSFYIADKNYKEECASLINKFLCYFLQNYVNGELLTKLVEFKISYTLKNTGKGKMYGLKNAGWFFSKL